jgi:hypothetical protein
MAQVVTLREEDHVYQKPDGTEIDSVSHILRFMSREYYSNIQQYTLDNAADRGTRVHKATEILDKWGEVEADADTEPYIRAYVQFKRDYKPKWDLIEGVRYSSELGFAGTIDRKGVIKGRAAKVDLKVQEQIKKPMVKAQLNGYDKLEPTEYLYCLQLKKDGTYKLHPIEKDDSEFMACLTLHRALAKKPRKKKGEPDGNTAE